MNIIKIILGDQLLDCIVESKDEIYLGKLIDKIEDNEILKFWISYEEAVNNMVLSEVDRMEDEMNEHRFYVVIGKKVFKASDVDLQIYPTNSRISFKMLVS